MKDVRVVLYALGSVSMLLYGSDDRQGPDNQSTHQLGNASPRSYTSHASPVPDSVRVLNASSTSIFKRGPGLNKMPPECGLRGLSVSLTRNQSIVACKVNGKVVGPENPLSEPDITVDYDWLRNAASQGRIKRTRIFMEPAFIIFIKNWYEQCKESSEKTDDIKQWYKEYADQQPCKKPKANDCDCCTIQ